ncbi:MAG: DUF6152 family protein [Candidatus Competibacteraceae bacterium]|nr:DUF6152 family protein [Candidatus Competibacteraceae bacterium]
MRCRSILAAALIVVALPVLAHHGWSSFNQDQPLYLAGTVKNVQWRNPHVEAVVTVADDLKLPADLAQRQMPAQRQFVDSAALLAKTRAPEAAGGDWEIEFAPLSRMEAWGITPLRVGDWIELIGYAGVPGKPKLLRVEYLIVDGQAYGLRSAPAR